MSERKIDGRKAEITHRLQYYRNWVSLAAKYGYPKAAYDRGKDPRRPLSDGDVVTLLTPTLERDGALLWIVQASNGEQFIYSEEGLRIMNENITVLPDESLGGVLREYRKVKRKANVGDLFMRIEGGFPYVPGVVYKAEYVDDTGAKDARIEHRLYHENYVVLEPTDIVRINDERFRTVDRKAAVGDRVIIVNEGRESGGGHYYRIGNVGAMLGVGFRHGNIRVDFSGNDEYRGDGKWAVSAGDYRVLEPVKGEGETEEATATQPLSSRPAAEQAAENIATLTAKVQALESRVSALEKADRQAPKTETFAEVSASLRKAQEEVRERRWKSAQQLRDEIVERAKADVEALTAKIHDNWVGSDIPAHRERGPLTVSFVINRDKRKVTALLRYKYFPGTVAEVGRAKCAPNDVFNAHIGRAIALRRALGLEVPAEYLSVPNPTEVRVGDVVVWVTQGSIGGRVTAVDATGKAHVDINWMTWVLDPSALKITDDTREGEVTSSAVKGVAA